MRNVRLTGIRILGAMIALLINLILAWTFQVEEIGQYFVSLGLIIFIAQLSTLGSEKWLVKKLSTGNNVIEKQKEVSLIFFLVFLGSLINYSLYKLFIVKVFSISISLNFLELYCLALFYILIAIFQALNKVVISLIFQYILQPIIFIALMLCLPLPLLKVYVISVLVCLFIACIYLFSSGFLRLRKFDISKIKPVLKSVLPYFSVLFFGLAVTHLSLPLSSFWVDDVGIAVMGVIIRLINILNFTITITRTLLLPIYSRAIYEKNEQSLLKLSWGVKIFPTFFVGCGCLIFAIFGENILGIFGRLYVDFSMLLTLSSLILLPAAYYSWHQSYLIANNQINLVNASSMITAIFIFTLIILLAPLYGVWGAVLVIIGGKTIYSLLTVYYNSSFYRFRN